MTGWDCRCQWRASTAAVRVQGGLTWRHRHGADLICHELHAPLGMHVCGLRTTQRRSVAGYGRHAGRLDAHLQGAASRRISRLLRAFSLSPRPIASAALTLYTLHRIPFVPPHREPVLRLSERCSACPGPTYHDHHPPSRHQPWAASFAASRTPEPLRAPWHRRLPRQSPGPPQALPARGCQPHARRASFRLSPPASTRSPCPPCSTAPLCPDAVTPQSWAGFQQSCAHRAARPPRVAVAVAVDIPAACTSSCGTATCLALFLTSSRVWLSARSPLRPHCPPPSPSAPLAALHCSASPADRHVGQRPRPRVAPVAPVQVVVVVVVEHATQHLYRHRRPEPARPPQLAEHRARSPDGLAAAQERHPLRRHGLAPLPLLVAAARLQPGPLVDGHLC